jgi:hypothetical protein
LGHEVTERHWFKILIGEYIRYFEVFFDKLIKLQADRIFILIEIFLQLLHVIIILLELGALIPDHVTTLSIDSVDSLC